MHAMHAGMQLLAAVEVGQYVSIWKILVLLVFLLIWARLMTWMDKDAIDAHLPRLMLNSIQMLLAVVGLVMFVLLPAYVVAISALVLAFVAGVGVYLGMRHQKVGLADLSKTFKAW